MIRKICNHKIAIIILHEIYGVNQFIEEVCSEWNSQGFDVFCPNMIGREFFTYTEVSEAYEFFTTCVGFDYFENIELFASQLRILYEKVFILGFSVGATIAWRCCENDICDGIICCYGSRIRDYMSIQPSCPTLLLFAEEDKFNVTNLVKRLVEKPNVEIFEFKASHGFLDHYSNCFNRGEAQKAKEYISNFMKRNQ